MTDIEQNDLEHSANSAETTPETSLNISRKTIEITAGILIAVISFFAGTSYQHAKQTNDIKKYTDLMNQAFGTFATDTPTDTPTADSDIETSDMNAIGQPCTFDDGYSINVIRVQQAGANVRVTVQAKNAGSQNIDLTLLESHYNYGPEGRAAKIVSNYGMSSNPFLEDGPLSPSMTMTREIVYSGKDITASDSTIQITGMQFGYNYAPCNFKTS